MKKKIEIKTEKSEIEKTQSSWGERKMTRMIIQNGITRSLGASLMVLALAASLPTVAHAASPASIDNTATVNGEDPTGTPITPIVSNDVEVDLDDPDNELSITKNYSFATAGDDADADGEGDAGDKITYTYVITNGGNTTLEDVGVDDTHEGTGTFPDPTFVSGAPSTSPAPLVGAATITLLPGESATFTTEYILTSADIFTLGGASSLGLDNDGNLDNSAVATGAFQPLGSNVSVTSTAAIESVPLDADSSLTLAKAAYEGSVPADIALAGGDVTPATAALGERPEGTVITYVYTVNNNGDVPISAIALSDAHTNAGGTSTVTPTFNSVTTTSPASSATTLYPGGTAYFTYQYTITQADIDAQ